MNFKTEQTSILASSRGMYWYKNGKNHRDGGPAIIYPNGNKHWFQNGLWHGEDGPAAIYSDGRKRFYIEGEKYNEKIYWEKTGK